MQTLKQKLALLKFTHRGIVAGDLSGNEPEVAEKIRKIDRILSKMHHLNQRVRDAS